jgi:hypothetical protein
MRKEQQAVWDEDFEGPELSLKEKVVHLEGEVLDLTSRLVSQGMVL